MPPLSGSILYISLKFQNILFHRNLSINECYRAIYSIQNIYKKDIAGILCGNISKLQYFSIYFTEGWEHVPKPA